MAPRGASASERLGEPAESWLTAPSCRAERKRRARGRQEWAHARVRVRARVRPRVRVRTGGGPGGGRRDTRRWRHTAAARRSVQGSEQAPESARARPRGRARERLERGARALGRAMVEIEPAGPPPRREAGDIETGSMRGASTRGGGRGRGARLGHTVLLALTLVLQWLARDYLDARLVSTGAARARARALAHTHVHTLTPARRRTRARAGECQPGPAGRVREFGGRCRS